MLHQSRIRQVDSKSSDETSARENSSDSSDDDLMEVKQAKRAGGEATSAISNGKGQGSQEVVRISHVASIEVKEAGIDSVEPNRRSTSPAAETTGRGSRRYPTSSRGLIDDGDNSSGSECSPMDDISKSPYEPDLNAEKGVKVFTDMKKLLSDNSHDNYRSVDPKAAKIFGPTNAWCLVKANALIEKSGMVYSQEWMHGNVRGNSIGKIPKDLLLLCLVAKRFEKAGEPLLSGLVRDLEVYNIVKDALKEWNLSGQFKKLSSSTKNFVFALKKRDCLKCEIFVARAYGCLKAFGMDSLDDALMGKIKTCLQIMEGHIADSSSKKRKSSEKAVVETSVSPEVNHTTKKSRRGRPTKSSVTHTIEKVEDPGDDNSDSDSDDPRNEPQPRHTTSSSVSAPRGRRANGKKESLLELVARFEQQYKDMGHKYEQMGVTLGKLKSQINENRASTEREIRSELLQEVQKTLMKK